VQTAVAAAGAYAVAVQVLGHDRPFFAAIAAVICLGTTLGQRGRRAAELVVGVALGIAVADVLALAIGTDAVALAVIVPLAMVTAVLLGGTPSVVSQAGISAILAVGLPSEQGFSPDRFLDCLAGGGVALVVNAAFPVNALRRVRARVRVLVDDLAGTLDAVADALAVTDMPSAEAALLQARALEEPLGDAYDLSAAARETPGVAPHRRAARRPLDRYGAALVQLELAVRNTRVLARDGLRVARVGEPAPPEVVDAVHELARAVRLLGLQLEGGAEPAKPRATIVDAVGRATAALEQRSDLALSAIVSQVRNIALDLLRATGLEREDAVRALGAPSRPA
jgi:uncharacterized membrane protein YgaE (UPF0421/DUF939 family)